jgi:hypothetical protein
VTLPLSTQPTATAGGQPVPESEHQPTGLYDSAPAALKSIAKDYSYWTGKLTESSFALSLAVIGANWAVFGSFDKVRNNIWAGLSIAAVLLTLLISLFGHWLLGELLRRRIAYAEDNAARWQEEFNENASTSRPWPSTKTIDNWAWVFRFAKMSLPILGGAFFVVAFFTEPKGQKDESHSGSSPSPTPALSSPLATASPSKSAAVGEIQAKPMADRELHDADSAKIRQWVENAIKRGEEWGKESPKPSPKKK